jgi:tRNA A-37 threonylcarbamoyl transferase component Bud32
MSTNWVTFAGVALVLLVLLLRRFLGVAPRRTRLAINPAHQSILEQWKLADADRLLALPAVIVSGHPNRNVAQVRLGNGPAAIRAFLKREHRVSYKERLLNAWAGFGFMSRSVREFQVLGGLKAAGIGCPEAIAAGEDSQGRAFLIIRELTGTVDLRAYLGHIAGRPAQRRRLIRRLGELFAQIHDSGFDHPDLYAKHIRIDPQSGFVYVLDWQRTRRRRSVTWQRGWRDLAALDASLADNLASPRERLTGFLVYLRATAQTRVPRSFCMAALECIRRHTLQLRQKRRIREQHHVPPATGKQNLIWLDGEALCVTREFQEEIKQYVRGDIRTCLDWMRSADMTARSAVEKLVIDIAGPRCRTLIRRRTNRPIRWLAHALRGHALSSPELEQMAILFRLQRFGVGTPRLLAVGQRHVRPWRTESFLLTEIPVGVIRLSDWLANQDNRILWTGERKQRRRWIAEAGRMLRRVHEAGYSLNRPGPQHFLLQPGADLIEDAAPQTAVVLGSLEGIQRAGQLHTATLRAELESLYTAFTGLLNSRTDELRFLREYLGMKWLTPAAKSLIRSLSGPRQKAIDPAMTRRRPATTPQVAKPRAA